VEEDYEELPAPIGLTPSPSSSSVRREDSLKINSSFKELKSTAHKHGPLWRKEKGVFYDPWRKYATVLHRHFLCMYSSEQGAKPYDSVDIKGFIARPVSNPRNEPKKNAIFEIVCPGKREYQVDVIALLICFCSSKGPPDMTVLFMKEENLQCRFYNIAIRMIDLITGSSGRAV
jgi:hypothetical protein